LVSKPKPGEILAVDPLPAPVASAATTLSDPHYPSGLLNPPDRRVDRTHRSRLALPDALQPFAPRRVCLSIFAADRRSGLLTPCSANRSVNPGTETIIYRIHRFVKQKGNEADNFPQFY